MNRILITGAAGYIGSALAKFLIKRNIDVTLIDNYYLPSNIQSIDGVEIQRIDIRDDWHWDEFDIIFHLAGVVGISSCEERSDEAFNVNVKGTFNLLKKCKGRFIFASSSAVYGQATEPEITEETCMAPRSVYGANKAYAENIVQLHTNYCILRFSNIYGKALTCKRTVADCFIENALARKDLLIHGDGKQRRDFVHINDVIKSYWCAMNSEYCGILNIGGNECLNINEIAKLVVDDYRELFGFEPNVKHIPIDCGVVWKDFYYLSKQAKNLISYEPQYSIKDEIRRRLNAHAKKIRR